MQTDPSSPDSQLGPAAIPGMKRPANILIVDDDDLIVRLIQLILESRGYSCVTAHSGAQGLSRFEKQDFDLVITDLNMSVGDGITFIESIRRKSEIPVVVVSGFAMEYAKRVRAFGEVHVFPKPLEVSALLECIQACCPGVGPATGEFNKELSR